MKLQKRFMKLFCLVLALTVLLPAIPAQASTDDLEVGYHASTTFGDENVSKAFDNDPATRWSASAEQNQWICAIFENEVVINSVEILEFWDRMNSFEIQYLDENGIWQTCASKTIEGEDTGIDTTHLLSFDDVTTTGMRLYIHDAPNWASIYEFKMFYNQPVPVAQVGEQSYTTVAEAIANANGGVVKLLDASDEAITISANVIIDLAGCTLSNVSVADGATLTLIDSATDDYEGEYGSATVSGTVAGGENYLLVSEGSVYSAHRYDVVISHISLKPAEDALGYKAQVSGDETVKSQITSVGFNLWVNENNVKTYTKSDANAVTLRLKNILACNGGEVPVYAEAFVTFSNGQTEKSAACSTTMKDTLQTINAGWADYSETQQTAVKALCDQYAVTKNWELTNIYPV